MILPLLTFSGTTKLAFYKTQFKRLLPQHRGAQNVKRTNVLNKIKTIIKKESYLLA